MEYEVKFPSPSLAKKFEKALSNVSPKALQDDIREQTLSLGENPRPQGEPKLKPPIEVYSFVAQYRLRVRNYRILYDVDDRSRTVWIIGLRKRNERTY